MFSSVNEKKISALRNQRNGRETTNSMNTYIRRRQWETGRMARNISIEKSGIEFSHMRRSKPSTAYICWKTKLMFDDHVRRLAPLRNYCDDSTRVDTRDGETRVSDTHNFSSASEELVRYSWLPSNRLLSCDQKIGQISRLYPFHKNFVPKLTRTHRTRSFSCFPRRRMQTTNW